MNYKNKHFKVFEREYESKFSGYRDENIEDKEKYIKKKLSNLPIHQLTRQLKIIELVWVSTLLVCIHRLCGMKIVYIPK